MSMSRILFQLVFANSETIFVMVVCSGILKVSSAVISLWNVIASNTVTVAPGMSVNTKFNRCVYFFCVLTILLNPAISQADYIAVTSSLFALEYRSYF